jgi:hypothetical protein
MCDIPTPKLERIPPLVSSGHREFQFPSGEFGSLEESSSAHLVLRWSGSSSSSHHHIIRRRGKKFFGGCDADDGNFNEVYIQLAEARPLILLGLACTGRP